MAKYIIEWNAGFGSSGTIIEADSLEEAEKWAYQEWEQEAQSQASYSAEEYTEEEADALGLI